MRKKKFLIIKLMNGSFYYKKSSITAIHFKDTEKRLLIAINGYIDEIKIDQESYYEEIKEYIKKTMKL